MREYVERLDRLGLRPRTLLAEPGRALSGPCQMVLLSVTEVVDRGSQGSFLICDAGSMALSPMLLTQAHRVMALHDREGDRICYQVLGPLPTSLDRVSSGVFLPKMRPGDRLAVLDAGAYFVSMNNTFGGPRLPVVWIEQHRAWLARRRETVEELFARDVFPSANARVGGIGIMKALRFRCQFRREATEGASSGASRRGSETWRELGARARARRVGQLRRVIAGRAEEIAGRVTSRYR